MRGDKPPGTVSNKIHRSFFGHWPRRSVRGKLTSVVLITTAIALLVAGAAMLRHDLKVYRQSWATDLATEAGILALSIGPALAFDDVKVAQRNLEAIRARPSVLAAAIYDARGKLYAAYARHGQAALPSQLHLANKGVFVAGERVQVTQRILQNEEVLGTIYILARYDVTTRLSAYVQIFSLVMLLSMGVAFALSTALRRAVTKPLEQMAEVARQIVVHRDYSLRASKTTQDEIGMVVEAFNKMLDEVQTQTQALERSNAALKDEVDDRQADITVLQRTERALRDSEKLYRAIGESIDYGVWICDAEGRNIYASESFLRLAGITQEECSSFGWGEALHPDDAPSTIAAWQDCVRSGVWYREHRFRGADGRYHPILAQGVPIRDEDGKTTGWAGINLDISRLKQTEEALRDADRRKDEFLATLAHELRNPLAPIRHAVKLLESTQIDEQQRQWGRDVISRQVQRMALLLDDLLDISRITRGRLELKKDYIDLATLVSSAVETARPLIESKGHMLEVTLLPEAIELEVDPLRLSQALSNLLTNAAKYTDAGGRIALTVSLEPDCLKLSVSDTGIGLSAAALPRLFEMFSQIDSAIDRAEGGLGIGLALVKGLVTLHGGSVQATSDGLGCGSEFTIRLPRTVVVTREVNPPLNEDMVLPKLRTPKRILITDDNRDAADTLAMVLQCLGYEVHVAYSGLQALEVGSRVRPEAIILDIGLPELNGYEVARRMRQETWGRRALLVALTGWGQEEDKERAKAAGFDHHLTKPVDPDHLQSLLADLLHERPMAAQ